MSRVKCDSREHIVYELTVNGLRYIGSTNIEPELGVVGSLKRRIAKHWYRLKDEKRSQWRLYRAIAELPNRDAIERRVIAVMPNKAAAHDYELALIHTTQPELNTEGA
jgi:hypothetical protein